MSFFKTAAAFALIAGLSSVALAADTGRTIKFNYPSADIAAVVQDYSKATGQKFIIDPQVHGKITILNAEPISPEEAFNQLSSALAINSLGISTQDKVMVIMQARSLQRNYIPTLTEVPPLKPERMTTVIFSLKHINADDINRQLRILTSKDGELVPFATTNQLVISDWSSNMQRIAAILQQLDKPQDGHGTKPVKK